MNIVSVSFVKDQTKSSEDSIDQLQEELLNTANKYIKSIYVDSTISLSTDIYDLIEKHFNDQPYLAKLNYHHETFAR